LLVLAAGLTAQVREYVTADTYTRYELLAPDTHSFKIIYEVTETRSGARFHFNIIRPGSEASDESVLDRATGKPLPFEVVSGKAAVEDGSAGDQRLQADAHYIRVKLARTVPARGEARLLIVKTYKDAASYFTEGSLIVYARSLGIPRNAIVLPRGYELVSVNTPVQIATESDGRVRVSYINSNPGEVNFRLTARKLP
jgi:hypothetical protein